MAIRHADVLVIGGGRAGLAAGHHLRRAETTRVTRRPPRLLPHHIDGRALFGPATRRRKEGAGSGIGDLGDIEAVEARRAPYGRTVAV